MSQSQKGAVPPLVIVIIVVLLALIGGGVYFLSKGGNLPVTIPTSQQIMPRATEKDFEFISDPTMRKHFVAQANVAAYRTKTSSSGKGTTDTMEVQTKGADFRWRTTVNDGKKDISDTIYIGDTTYIKDYKDGKWWKQTIKPQEASGNQTQAEEKPIDIKEEIAKEKDKLTFKFLGKEPCGNLTCYKYQQSFGLEAGTQLVWFDDREYLSRKEESSFGEFKTTVEYSYDNINVAPPAPTKDVPAGKNIYEYMYREQTGGSQYLPIKEDFNLPTFPPEEDTDVSGY